jgi:nucleoside-diphosphate-sugar epimerase
MRRILITGAAGRLGTVLAGALAASYELVLADARPVGDTHGARVMLGNIADLDAVRPMVAGVDTVVHLAGNPSPDASWESLLEPNVLGLRTVFEAASQAGCRRVVYASSVHVVLGYPHDTQVHTSMPVRPADLYGVTKAWGEVLARYYADQRGLSAICLRFGWVTDRDNPRIRLDPGHLAQPERDDLDRVLTHGDLVRLITASIEAPDTLRFGIFHGVSNNRWKRLDISDAAELLGYQPEDDAYTIAAARMSQHELG